MNRIIAAALGLTAALLVTANPAVAASGEAAALKRELGPGVRVAEHHATGKVRFVGTAAGRPIGRPAGLRAGASPRLLATTFLNRHAKAFGFRAGSLRVTASKTTAGRSAVRFQQLNAGVPVIGGEFVVSLDSKGNLVSASGEALPETVAVTPGVGAAAARVAAVAAVAKKHDISAVRLSTTDPSLAVYDPQILGGPGPRLASLVWRLEVTGPGATPIDELVLVDAQRGHVAVSIDQIQHALSQRICDANNTETQLPCTAPVASDPSDPPTGSDHLDVRLAYEYAADTYNFFAGLGRDSLDDSGMPLVSTVRFCDLPQPCPYANAFWNGEQMAYGQGFAAADDVVGHELAHGVTDFSAHLFYYYQSGAINESLSDVYGEFVDQTNASGTDTPAVKWQMGEDVPGFGAIRNMADPPEFNHADRMTSPLYTADQNELDSGGVHQNSGVNNKAAYLMTDGDSFNGRTVTGLGISKVSRIYYAVQTTMLTSASDYADLAAALPQACANLIGTAGITAADCTEVGDAVAAVEMNVQPPAAPAPEAPVCASGLVPTDLFSDNLENTASGNWTAQTGWHYPQNNLNPYVGFDATYATSGTTNLWGDDPDAAAGTHSISMTRSIAIPAGSTAFLRFNHAFGFEDDASGAYDGGVLEVSTNNGASYADIGSRLTDVGYNGTLSTVSNNPIEGRNAFVRESNGYQSSRATLSTLGGQSVRFRFTIGRDTSVGDYGWFIDDVRIYTCAALDGDGDGDGVPDASDACPTVAAATPSGCPAPTGGTGGTTGGTPGGTAGGTPGGTSGGTPGGTTAATLRQAGIRACRLRGTGRRATVRCTLRRFAAVRRATVTLKQGKRTVARKTVRPSRTGVLSIKPGRTLRRGTYKLTVVLRDARGDKRTLNRTLRVR